MHFLDAFSNKHIVGISFQELRVVYRKFLYPYNFQLLFTKKLKALLEAAFNLAQPVLDKQNIVHTLVRGRLTKIK